MMSGSKAPDFDTYGLLRATHYHNPTQYYNRNIVFTKVKRVTPTKFLVMTITKNSANLSRLAESSKHIIIFPRTGSVHPHFLPS